MKKKKIKNPLDNPELHHKMLLFWVTMIMSVVITRLIVLFHNPNPALFSFEIHHFDYGIMLLLLNTFLMIFGIRHDALHVAMAAFATGMIVDDYWYIRTSVVENDSIQTQVYNATLPAALVFAAVVTLCIIYINARRIKKIRLFAESFGKKIVKSVNTSKLKTQVQEIEDILEKAH